MNQPPGWGGNQGWGPQQGQQQGQQKGQQQAQGQPQQQWGAQQPQQQWGAQQPQQQPQQQWGAQQPQQQPQQQWGAQRPQQQQQWGAQQQQQPQQQQPWGAQQNQPYGMQAGYGAAVVGPTPPLQEGGLKEAILEGTGFANPRKDGLGYIGIGVLCVVGVFVVALVTDTVFIYPAVVGPVLIMPGLFMVGTAEPLARPAGQKAPGWARAGLTGSTAAGIAAGLYTLFWFLG